MRAALRLLRIFSLRHIARRKLRFALAGTSVLLAVALFVSMRVTEASILASFERSAEALAGKADAVVTRGLGIEAEALARIEAVGRLRAAPVIQESTVAPDLETPVVVLGVDFARDARLREFRPSGETQIDVGALLVLPNSALLPRSFAERHGLGIGSTIRIETRRGLDPFRVAGLLDDRGPAQALGGHVVVTGVAAAQAAFGRRGRYDRIDVAFDGATADDLRRALGPEYEVRPAPRSNPVLDYQLAQLRTVLSSVTAIAVVIGVFIIYNSLSLSVVERVKDIGILRAIGARRSEVVATIALEAALVGLAASAAGAAAGVAIARALIAQIARYMNLLTFVVDVREITVPPGAVAVALAVGLVTSVAGAAWPAWEASRVAPAVAVRPAAFGIRFGRRYRWAFGVGLALFAAAVTLAVHPRSTHDLVVGSLVLGFAGLAGMLPHALLAVSGLLRWIARRALRVEAYLALDNLVKFPSRTALTVIAFAGSLSMIVSISGALGSAEHASLRWLGSIFPFDLTVQLNDFSTGAYTSATFPESVIEEVERDPRVDRAYGVRVAFVPYREATVMLLAMDQRTFMDLRVERGLYADAERARRLVDEMEAGGVTVSENFAQLHGVRAGDEVELATPRGPRRFRVLEAVQDFSWPAGVVMFDRAVYREIWDDGAITYLDIRAREGADLAALKLDLARGFRDRHRVYIYETAEIRDMSMRLLREWFRLADAQIFLAVIIGAIGVVNTLLISLLTRARQIGLLRAVGASMRQITASLAVEALVVGLLSAALGSAMGLFVVRFPITRMTVLVSGYTLPFVFPARAIGLAFAGGLVIALLASTAPIRFARRIDVVDAIGYE